MGPLTGFKAKAVSGYVPTPLFFNSLKHREFPTTITIRDSNNLTYLPEPDIFHDLAGHVPMHTDRTFADLLATYGSLAQMAVERQMHIVNTEERLARIRSNLQALSRFFWFSIEFGLMREGGGYMRIWQWPFELRQRNRTCRTITTCPKTPFSARMGH